MYQDVKQDVKPGRGPTARCSSDLNYLACEYNSMARLQKLQKLQKHKFLNKAEKPCAAGVFSPKTTKTTKTTKNMYIDKS